MRLQTAPRELLSPRRRRVSHWPAIRAAAGTGVAAVVCVLLLLSPSFAVRSVQWSGVVQSLELRLPEVEEALRGRPLMLLSEKKLRDLLQVDPQKLQLHFERHLPGTLEIVVLPRLAVWETSEGAVFDAQGRGLDSTHAVPGLKRLAGFALGAESEGLDPEDVRLLSRLLEMEKQSGLNVRSVARRGDEIVLTLSPSGQAIWLDARQVEPGLRKLRMLSRRLDASQFPARVDLRFRDQIVLVAETK